MPKRIMVLWINPEQILTLLGQWRQQHYLALPWLERCADGDGRLFPLPKDADLIDCCYDWHRGRIGIKLRHDSFPEVADGHPYPYLYATEYTVEVLPIKNPDAAEDAPIIVEVQARANG